MHRTLVLSRISLQPKASMHDSIYRAPKIDMVARTREAEHWIREATGRPARPREAEAVARILKGNLPVLTSEQTQDGSEP